MKKIALLLCLCLLLPACGNSENANQDSVTTTTAITTVTTREEDLFPDEPDFRNVNWGMSPQLVKEREKDGWAGEPTNKDNDNILYQNVDCAGYNTNMIYQFTKESKLYVCMYKFLFDKFDQNDIIATYKGIKAKLIKLYGEPTGGDFIYSSDYRKTSLENAFLLNQVTLFFEWETDTTLIQLHVENTVKKKGDITFNLLYRSKEYDPDYTDPATTTTTNGKGSKGL